MSSHESLLIATLALFASAALPAQDLLGVTWAGAVVLVDSHTAGVATVGNSLQGLNSLARSPNGTFWASRRISTSQSNLVSINPNTGAATPVFACGDLRGLAAGPGNSLYGIQNAVSADLLVRIDLNNGFAVTIGSTGYDGVQGLAVHQGVIYAWDVFAGLLIVDPVTGAATDPFPGVGGPPYLQSLCSHPDGRLLVGGGDSNGTDQLYSLDVTNGMTTLIGLMVGAVDVRGLEPLASFTVPFGQGCNGAAGPVVLSVTGTPQVGGTLVTLSTNHAPNALGAVLFGLSTTMHQGLSLPRLLDPQLGTSNCSLYTSIDASFIVLTGAGAPASMQFSFGLSPAAIGATFHLQHACFEPVPGNLSWSNGVTVQVR